MAQRPLINFEKEIAESFGRLAIDPVMLHGLQRFAKLIRQEFDYVQKQPTTSPEAAIGGTVLVSVTSITSSLALGIYAAKRVDLISGENTVTFTDKFDVPFEFGILGCVGEVEGNPTLIGYRYRMADVTSINFKITVDAACTLTYFAIASH